MLAYAGKGRFVVEPIDLTTLTEELLPLLRISIARQANLDLRLARGLPVVMADATQLRQIVMNLVLNAADAIAATPHQNGEIAISTGVMHAGAELLGRSVTGAALPERDYIYLEVRDTGIGMTADVIAKIFDPFFTTKFAGRGLGLAAVLGIVRGHEGALQVESTPGQGSTFRLLLPPAKPGTFAAPPAPTESDRGKPWRYSGTVLVVEDEEHVRMMTVEVLKSFGFTVHDAVNGTEGVSRFRASPDAFDVVVLDMLMPGLNGEQTLAALRLVKPDVRVLLVSGYHEGDLITRAANSGRLAFLPKPFTRAALERKLRELLE
jgi:CheY-like chemotaxis protein